MCELRTGSFPQFLLEKMSSPTKNKVRSGWGREGSRGEEAMEDCRCLYEERVKGRQDSTKMLKDVWRGGEAMSVTREQVRQKKASERGEQRNQA